MGEQKQPMTVQGKARLEEELKQLLQFERPNVIKAIEEARSNGDLSENADYDAAKERQGFIEARIADIQSKIANSEVIDPSALESDRIIFGAHVVLEDLDINAEVSYQIVGEDEADVKNGKLSVFSPLARSIIGKKKGDIVEFKTPKSEKEYEVKKFFFK
ncbi:MAG: transcription elongation factor GreA [Bdellovibrionota bacterium]